LELENERVKLDSKMAFDSGKQHILEEEQSKRKLLEDQIMEMQRELSSSKSSQAQMSSIRQNLERDKELELLTMKKEILSQKEKQLQDIRIEMNSQKDELKRLFHIEMEAERTEFESEKNQLCIENNGFYFFIE
jgi:hypothetical protein